MRKELSPNHEMVACDVCGRTILKGERTEPYLVADGTRRLVCELCTRRAEGAGWLRESRQGDLPAALPRTEPRRSLLSRLRRRFVDEPPPPGEAERRYGDEQGAPLGWNTAGPDEPQPPEASPQETWVEPPPAAAPGEQAVRWAEQAHSAAPAEGAWPAEAHAEDAAAAADDRGYAAEEAFAEEQLPESHAGEAALPRDPLPAPEESLLEEPAAAGPARDAAAAEEPLPQAEMEPPPTDARAERRERRSRRRLRDPRHVRAVPTNAEAKVERALELFNASEHRRTVAGLVRTLGQPLATAVPSDDSTSEVTLVVAWELSWYQFRVDLADSPDAVTLTDKGDEIAEIDAPLRDWNACASEDGALEIEELAE